MLEVRPKTNEVVVGPKEALDIAEIAGRKFSWAGLDPVASGITEADAAGMRPFDCEVQIRAHADPVPATARLAAVNPADYPDGAAAISASRSAQTSADYELVITPNTPLNGVAPGQTAVVYVGTRVLGQCTIDRTVSAVTVS